MTPKQYLDRYTYLSFYSPWNNELVNAGITGYGSGLGAGNGNRGKLSETCSREHGFLRKALRFAHHGADTPCGSGFKFDKKPAGAISPSEEFYPETFIHAFDGKGSPDEIIDTLRIAMLSGRIGTGRDMAGQPAAKSSAAEYVAAFITLDCNGLVKNFYGDTSDAISNYAKPARKRTQASHVKVGDCIVTHSAAHPHEHIGLIADWKIDATDNKVRIVRIVEWGQKGGEEKHYGKEKTVNVVQGPDKNFGIGFATTSPKYGVATFRYIFAPSTSNAPHGWS